MITQAPRERGRELFMVLIPTKETVFAEYAAELATAKKFLGVTDQEIDQLCRSVVDALARGPLDPKALKDAPRGYAIFDAKQDRAIKVMLKP